MQVFSAKRAVLRIKNALIRRAKIWTGIDIPFCTNFSSFYYHKIKKARGVIYMLHRVSDRDTSRLLANEGLKVSAAFLDQFIRGLKSRNIDLVSMDEVYYRISESKRNTHPFAAFTLDDGYLDNYEQAVPVFREHGVPYIIYLSTSIPDQNAFLWWFDLENMILKHDHIQLLSGEIINCSNKCQKEQAFSILRSRILNLPQVNLLQEIRKILPVDFELTNHASQMGLSWAQIAELSEDPLCTIGGHTVNHLSLAKLSESMIFQEVIGGIDRIQKMLNIPIHHFAFPFGSPKEAGQRETNLFRKTALRTCSVGYGGVLHQSGNDLMALPRVYLTEQL